MKKTDLLWILAYPIYQLIGTFRHEASHALVAVLEGARITEFVFWPTRGFWGYVKWEGPITSTTIGAPYVCDLMIFIFFFGLCMAARFERRWVWLNAVVVGMISPFINSGYNYWGGLRGPNDVGKLLENLPPIFVHTYFLLTMGLYLVGLVVVFKWSRTARAQSGRVDLISEGGEPPAPTDPGPAVQ
jgi:hypothetical protein